MILYQSAFYTPIQRAPTHASAIGSLAKVTLFVKYSQVNYGKDSFEMETPDQRSLLSPSSPPTTQSP